MDMRSWFTADVGIAMRHAHTCGDTHVIELADIAM